MIKNSMENILNYDMQYNWLIFELDVIYTLVYRGDKNFVVNIDNGFSM